MHVAIKCFATLASHQPASGFLELPDGATVAQAVAALDLAAADVCIILVNGKTAHLNSSLHEGDRLSLLPLISGG